MKILNFSNTYAHLCLLFLCLLTYSATAQLAHIDYPNMPADKEAALKIDYGTSQSAFKVGVRITGVPLSSNQTGQRDALRVENSSNYSSQSGSSYSQIAAIKSYNGDASFIGVIGEGRTTAIRNSNGLTSRALGGYFRTGTSTNVTLSSGKFDIGGVLAELNGSVNNTPTTGAVAAIIGRDFNTGTAQSWAAYLEGKNYLSDQTIIGRKDIPTQVNLPDGPIDVSNFKLFVKGGIVAEECLIALESLWADYVFEEDYDLKSLEEVEAYINKNGYLPAFPSALEIDKMGLAVGQITVLQQEKIEELFLHSIELNKQNKDLVDQNEILKAENEQLKAQMTAFEKRLLALENK